MPDDIETPNATPDKARDGWSWWLMAAVLLTLLYGCLFWVVVSPANACFEGAIALCGPWERLTRLSLNELGDFLAGAFAPLAFLWLVAAVGVQAQELAAQRRELRQTRLEFVQSREVAQQQVLESKKQAEFVGAQVELAKAQDAARRLEANGFEVQSMVRGVVRQIERRLDDGYVAQDGRQESYIFPSAKAPYDEYEKIEAFSTFIWLARQAITAGQTPPINLDMVELEEIADKLDSIRGQIDRVPDHIQARLYEAQLDTAIESIDAILGPTKTPPSAADS